MSVLDFEAALAEVMRHAGELRERLGPDRTEEAPLLESAGRVLARPILADRDQPPFDRATRDGFAVRASEFSSRSPLRVTGQVRAGDLWTGEPLASGEAIEIMTGAPVPAGADAVAMVEHVEFEATETPLAGKVRAADGRILREGENIVPRGSEARAGAVVVPAGTAIAAAEIALAATAGMATLTVYARPTVAIVATGDELVELNQTPDARQIRNSNSYALAALVASAGGSPSRLAIARDLREELHERLSEARKYDLILLSGGVSMGKFDLVEEVLAELGAEFIFTGVKMQPGKPLVFGRLPERMDGQETLPERYFFGLPGNPVSTQVTFHCFVEPLLRVIAGEEVSGPQFVQATLLEDVDSKQGLTRVLPARLTNSLKQPSVRLVSWQGSGDLAANARANCYAVLPAEGGGFRSGDVITVLLR
jgi:molybdopterin molybdotransferase